MKHGEKKKKKTSPLAVPSRAKTRKKKTKQQHWAASHQSGIHCDGNAAVMLWQRSLHYNMQRISIVHRTMGSLRTTLASSRTSALLCRLDIDERHAIALMEFASCPSLPAVEIYRVTAPWAIARIHPNRSATTARGEVEVMAKGVHSVDGQSE